MIEINHLVKKYGDHVAVDDLSLTIEPGRIYGFLGPNGAGKSTTMNILTGYLGATSGEVTINGYNIFANPEEAKKCIGYLPELPPVYMDMTVLEYMSFVAELKQIEKGKRKEAVLEAMELTKIVEMKNRLIKNLSKGYRQRVGLAQAILGYPEVIILDEPTVGLDPKQIIEMRELIHELGKKHTVILSSHILTEVSAVCDYIFIISKGKLVASDTTENLTNLMAGHQEISLTVKGELGITNHLFEDLTEIEKAEVASGSESGTVQLTITAKEGADIREDIFYCCAKKQVPILAMKSEGKTLEDVFLELTTQDVSKQESRLVSELENETENKEEKD